MCFRKDELLRLLTLWRAILIIVFLINGVSAQSKIDVQPDASRKSDSAPTAIAVLDNQTAAFADEAAGSRESTAKPILTSALPQFYHAQNGLSVGDLIALALRSNGELQAARFDIERAKAKRLQAGLRPNPTLEFEQSSGRILGSPGGGDFTVGASIPVELYGRRARRIEVADIEIAASEALVKNRERQLAANVLNGYADALTALRELEATEELLELDLQTTRFVQIRVNEGDTAPLELNLLQAEVERLRARIQLANGRIAAALTQLKLLAGIEFDQPLRLREQMTTAVLPPLPKTREAAYQIALQNRADVRLAIIEEQAATAGLRLVRAAARPDLTVYSRYTAGRLGFRNLAETVFPSRDRSLTFGAAIGLPIFNKQQGSRAESEIVVRQAQTRREFAEKVARSEIAAAFERIAAAASAVAILETGALPRGRENVVKFRQVYELGEIKITDLITEQRRLLDAARDLTEAQTLRYRAQADLIIAVGAAEFVSQPE